MKTIKLNLAELKAPERNVRIHTEKQIEEFIRSIKMFGQIRPVVVDEDYTILAGNGLVEALRRMGKIEADILVVSNLTENQKKKLMIADNKIFSLGIENLETLNAFLEELQNDLDIPGFDEEILKTMVADSEEVTEKIAEYGTLDDEEIKAIKEKREIEVVQQPHKEITEKYEVSLSTVKSWASRHWKEKGRNPKKAKVATKEKKSQPRGAPKGNKNAVGKIGGAPARNRNNYKHGVYEHIYWDTLDDEEKLLIFEMSFEEELCKGIL